MDQRESRNCTLSTRDKMEKTNFLKIDGSMGEGGGAIIRLGAGYSCLYNQPIKISNIRSNRPKPGLRLQHLLGLKTLTDLTHSSLSESQVGTEELTFIPSGMINDSYLTVNIKTAASLGLLLQPIQIAALGLKASNKISLDLNGGGTYGKWAPSIDYLIDLTFNFYKFAGLNIDVNILRHGFYPKGGAQVKCSLSKLNQSIAPIKLNFLGNIEAIKGKLIITSQLRGKSNIIERIKRTISKELKSINHELDIKHKWVDSYSPGVGIHLQAYSDTGAIISSGTILGDRNISSEKLGLNASKELIKYIKNDIPVDNYLSDQLIPLIAYAEGHSSIKVLEITDHTKTNLELIKLFNDREYFITNEKSGYRIEYN